MGPFIESEVTDIEIAPDGRLFIFGASRELMEILVEMGSPQARRRTDAARRPVAEPAAVCAPMKQQHHD